METNSYSTWLEIDLSAITENISRIKQITNNELMGVIKANGYGHGAIPAAKAAVKGGATWCGVARIEEALALRNAGISCNLLVLGYTPPNKIPDAIEHQIQVTIFDRKIIKNYLEHAKSFNNHLFAHVKVETGFGRLGIFPKDVPELLKWLKGTNIKVHGIFTHFAAADEIYSDSTHKQLMLFDKLLAKLKEQKLKPTIVHAANSAAIFNFPESHYDMVRPGIAIFGISPSSNMRLGDGFKPALSWKARVTALNLIPLKGDLKNKSLKANSNHEQIGVIPVGFGDGFRENYNHEVLVNGKRASVVGSIFMDQCMLQLKHIPEVHVDDEVILIGKQGNLEITVEDIAKRWGIINYEVVAGLAARIPRIYIKGTS